MRLIGEGRVYFVAERGPELLLMVHWSTSGIFSSAANSRMARAQGPTESPLARRSMGVTRTNVAPRRRVSVRKTFRYALKVGSRLGVGLRPVLFLVRCDRIARERNLPFSSGSAPCPMRRPVTKLLEVSPPSALLQTAISGLKNWHIWVGQLPPGPRRGSPTVESPAVKRVGTSSAGEISMAATAGRLPLNSDGQFVIPADRLILTGQEHMNHGAARRVNWRRGERGRRTLAMNERFTNFPAAVTMFGRHEVSGFGADGVVRFALGVAERNGNSIIALGDFDGEQDGVIHGRHKTISQRIAAAPLDARRL